MIYVRITSKKYLYVFEAWVTYCKIYFKAYPLNLVAFTFRKADSDQQNGGNGQTASEAKVSSTRSSTSMVKPQLSAILDGLRLIFSSTYLLYVSLFLWLGAVVSSFFYFQVKHFLFLDYYLLFLGRPLTCIKWFD